MAKADPQMSSWASCTVAALNSPVVEFQNVLRILAATVVAWLAAEATPAAAQGTFPLTAADATAWLQGKSLQLISESRATMTDGSNRTAFAPQAGAGYNAFWLRDYAYMLEGAPAAISNQQATDAALLFVASARPSDGAGVDRVCYDGTPLYKPGPNGDWGDNPVADGSQFTVDIVYNTYQKVKDPTLLTRTVNGKSVIDSLVTTMNAVPRDSGNQLVYINPNATWDRCPYGFTDSIRKTGDDLRLSLTFTLSPFLMR